MHNAALQNANTQLQCRLTISLQVVLRAHRVCVLWNSSYSVHVCTAGLCVWSCRFVYVHTLGLQGISIISNIEVFFFKGSCNNAFLVNTVIPYIAILSANLAFLGVKSLVNDTFTQ